jgi:hypothetical protein
MPTIWRLNRSITAAKLAFKAAGQVFAADAFGGPHLTGAAGQLGRARGLDRTPGQGRGKHAQRMPQVDHLLQSGAEVVVRSHRQLPQKSSQRRIEFRGSPTQDSRGFQANCLGNQIQIESSTFSAKDFVSILHLLS